MLQLRKVERNRFRLTFPSEKDTLRTSWQLFLINKGTNMEIFGGFMVMLSILGFFLAVLWFILPFVVFAMKGKLDRACELLEIVDQRLASIEQRLIPPENAGTDTAPPVDEPAGTPSGEPDATAGE